MNILIRLAIALAALPCLVVSNAAATTLQEKIDRAQPVEAYVESAQFFSGSLANFVVRPCDYNDYCASYQVTANQSTKWFINNSPATYNEIKKHEWNKTEDQEFVFLKASALGQLYTLTLYKLPAN